MTYHIFCTFLNLTLISRDEFISKLNLDELKSDPISLYELVLAMTPQLLFQYIRVFIANDEVRFLERVGAFEIVDLTDGGEQTAGRIDGRNFDRFRESVASVLGLKKPVDKPVRFKSERARKLMEKIRSNKSSVKKQDEAYEFDNMVLKYCTHNKVGINLLNVGGLTYYQFIRLFYEYIHARQSDYGDALAANTFSYKDPKDYSPMQWIEKLKDGNF